MDILYWEKREEEWWGMSGKDSLPLLSHKGGRKREREKVEKERDDIGSNDQSRTTGGHLSYKIYGQGGRDGRKAEEETKYREVGG